MLNLFNLCPDFRLYQVHFIQCSVPSELVGKQNIYAIFMPHMACGYVTLVCNFQSLPIKRNRRGEHSFIGAFLLAAWQGQDWYVRIKRGDLTW